jgi:hypothetical protein
LVIPGCQKKPDNVDASHIPENLSISGLQLHARYIKDVNSGKQERSEEIAKKYWTDEIKRLNPIKAYWHKNNIVLVQKESANKQEGLYINIIISSYAPRSGDDGFTFTDIGNSVYKFKRTTEY